MPLLLQCRQVHAAKRWNEARQRPGAPPSAARPAAAPSGVPRLLLASLSRAGSTAGELPSGQLCGQENDQREQQQRGRRQQSRSPMRSGRRTDGSARGMGEAAGVQSSLNILPLSRDDRVGRSPTCPAGSAPAAGGSARAAAVGPQQSHVSLSDLLDCSSRGASGGSSAPAPSAASGSVRLRHSSFSVADATSAAASTAAAVPTAAPSAAAAAGAAAAATTDVGVVAGACDELPAQAEFIPVVRPAAAGPIPTPAEPAAPTASLLAGEAAEPPIYYTSRESAFAHPSEQTPRSQMLPGGGTSTQQPGGGGLMGRLLGKLASPFKLQSPPATPLDAAASGGKGGRPPWAAAAVSAPPATEASSSSASSGQVRLRRFEGLVVLLVCI